MNCRTLVPGAFIAFGLLFGLSPAMPPSHAGQAVIPAPAEGMAAPEGSQIPQARIEETEEKARAYKEKMRAKSAVQQQQSAPQEEAPKPQAEQP